MLVDVISTLVLVVDIVCVAGCVGKIGTGVDVV